MTRRQIMSLYYESFIIEAQEQLRLIVALKYGHPSIDAEKYMNELRMQAEPFDKEADAEIDSIAAVKRLQRLAGGKDLKSSVGDKTNK